MIEQRPLVTRTETRTASSETIVVDFAPRCSGCHKVLLAMATRPWAQQCQRRECRQMNYGNTETK